MSGAAKQAAFMKGLKRKPVKKAAPVIPSFAEQHAATLKRAEEVSAQNREREAARIQRLREIDEKERIEKEAQEKRKRKYAKDLRVERDIEEVLAEDDSLDVTQPPKRRVQRRPSIAEVPSFVKNLDAPEHDGAPGSHHSSQDPRNIVDATDKGHGCREAGRCSIVLHRHSQGGPKVT